MFLKMYQPYSSSGLVLVFIFALVRKRGRRLSGRPRVVAVCLLSI